MEEPVADLELTLEVREQNAAYIGSRLTIFKNDMRATFSTTAHAQHTADFLNAFQSLQEGEWAAA